MFSCLPPGPLGLADLSLKWKSNGVDISIDGAELEGMSTEHLQHMFNQHLRGSAGVPGSKEDFSDMSSKWQEVECDVEGEGFQVLSYFSLLPVGAGISGTSSYLSIYPHAASSCLLMLCWCYIVL